MSADHNRLKLLVVDGSKEDFLKFERLIRTGDEFNADVGHAHTGSEALDLCITQAPDCILLENHLPDLDGLEFLANFAKIPSTSQIPILMLTGMGSEALAVESIKRGA